MTDLIMSEKNRETRSGHAAAWKRARIANVCGRDSNQHDAKSYFLGITQIHLLLSPLLFHELPMPRYETCGMSFVRDGALTTITLAVLSVRQTRSKSVNHLLCRLCFM